MRKIRCVAFMIALVQVLLWSVYGRFTLIREAGPAASHMLALREADQIKRGYMKPGQNPPWTIVVPTALAHELGSAGLGRLRDAGSPFNAKVDVTDDFHRGGSRWKFSFKVRWNTPLIAMTETTLYNDVLAAWGFATYHIHVFGFWFRIADGYGWIS